MHGENSGTGTNTRKLPRMLWNIQKYHKSKIHCLEILFCCFCSVFFIVLLYVQNGMKWREKNKIFIGGWVVKIMRRHHSETKSWSSVTFCDWIVPFNTRARTVHAKIEITSPHQNKWSPKCFLPYTVVFHQNPIPVPERHLRHEEKDGVADEAHCCDTSRSLQILIGQHSKATSSEQGCKPILVKWLLYRSDVWIQLPTELACLACTLQYSWDGMRTEYQIPTLERTKYAWQTYTERKDERPDIALLQCLQKHQIWITCQTNRFRNRFGECICCDTWNFWSSSLSGQCRFPPTEETFTFT